MDQLDSTKNDEISPMQEKKKRKISSNNQPVIHATENYNNEEEKIEPVKQLPDHQKDWGIIDVLFECGVSSLNISDVDNNFYDKGCMLEADVNPNSLRASIHALLKEMVTNSIDKGNNRVIESLNRIVATGHRPSEVERYMDKDHVMNSGIRKNALLRSLLLPMYNVSEITKNSNEPDGNGRTNNGMALDSAIKILLRIDAIQTPLINSMLQKVPDFVSNLENYEEPSNNSNSCHFHAMDEEIPRLILSHIRWLEWVIDPSSLNDAALECLSVVSSTADTDCPDGTSRCILLDLIATLPDIIDSTSPDQLDIIVSTLRDVRLQDPTLLLPCLDAVGSLRFTTNDQIQSVVSDALDALESVTAEEAWSLPAICKFLCVNVPSNNNEMCSKVVDSLRRLKLGLVGHETEDNEVTNKGKDLARHDQQSAEALMLEALSQGFQYRSDLTNALLNAVKSTLPNHHPAADLWLLFCCAVAPHNKTKIKALIRAKSVSGAFNVHLLGDVIRSNGMALGYLFQSSLIDLADSLVRSPEKSARDLGGNFYKELFWEFVEPIQRQEIVGLLAIHVGSGGSAEEIDIAMQIFSSIVAMPDGSFSLRPFLPFLTSLLDHIHQISSNQLRRLYLLFFAVGGFDDTVNSVGSGGGCDDVQIVIRKHLSLSSVAMKRIGIIADCFL